MTILREAFDGFYDLIKNPVFYLTEKNPEIAHELFTNAMMGLYSAGLERAVLGFDAENRNIKISNAAGFNKNGFIPPTALRYLGFDRVVVGTVTGESYEGNPKPRIKRFPETNSMLNWMGLPGIGAEKAARVMENYGEHGVPITINLAPTPEITEISPDLKKSVYQTKDLHGVDRYELNVSCPNTGEDERAKHMSQLFDMLNAVCDSKNSKQEVYIKVSPDLTEEDAYRIARVSENFPVAGFTATNTTTKHNPIYIPQSPGKGGASGDAVYKKSLAVQKMFYESSGKDSERKIIACGGINSRERMRERISHGASEIQLFTPLIFQGPRLLRELRRY